MMITMTVEKSLIRAKNSMLEAVSKGYCLFFYFIALSFSGQQVLGGPRDRNRDFLSGVFEAVRRAGAEEMPAEELVLLVLN